MSTLRRRLWKCGLALGLFLLVLVIGNFFTSTDKSVSRRSAGHDFLAFYTAGTFVRTGRSAELYDLGAVAAFQRDLAQREGLELPDNVLGPFWNPPFFACVFAPLSALPYHTAWSLWFLLNVAALTGAIILLSRMIGGEWRTWGLVPLLIVTSPPLVQALGHGQNTCISLLLLAGSVALWRRDRAILAGVVAGLLFYKPQLGALLGAALVITLGWKTLIGFAITGVALLLTTLVALPGTLFDWLNRLPDNLWQMQVAQRYMWDRHVTLKAFWRLLIQGHEPGELTPLTRTLYLSTTAALAACLFATLWKCRNHKNARDLLIAAAIVCMPLLMPFYFDYDLLLLSAAAVVYSSRTDCQPVHRAMWLWIALFICTAFNASLAGWTHVNVGVIVLTALAAVLIAAARRRAVNSVETIFEPAQLRPAA